MNINSNLLPTGLEDPDEEEFLDTNHPPQDGPIGPSVGELRTSTSKQLTDFNDLLDTIASTEDKQKSLWKLIYENAITDRMNAYLIWTDLYHEVKNKPAEHAIHGQNLSRYMERMSKANDQLLKLAELVGSAKKKSEPVETTDDIYSQLEAGSAGKH